MMAIRAPRRRFRLAVAAAVTMLAAGCASSAATLNPNGQSPVTFCVADPALSTSTAPYASVPIQKGFYAEKGLDVDVLAVKGATQCAIAVSTGEAFVAFGGMTSLLFAAQQDDQLVIFYVTDRQRYGIAVPSDSPYQDVTELKGKSIGAQDLAAAAYLYGQAITDRAGMDPSSDVSWLNVGSGATAADALQTGKIDAYATYTGPKEVVGDILGSGLRYLPAEMTESPASAGFVVRRDDLEKHPELVAAFGKAVNEGIVFSQENPREATRLHWKQFPEQADQENVDRAVEVLRARAAEMSDPGEDGQLGYVPPEDVQATADSYVDGGLLETSVDTSTVVDLRLADQMNDFDRDAIIEMAKNPN
ncbi:WD-40 repeat-containing protein [Tamaricihabitans halophyticus]|uniref:WD-40 repeat-containing protein n=1 Tax=Tamaricihabitans halophyticus TaxID=1262583 RepID=A0A4R2QFC3_9PSEU|nr:ABC transporter substrate-binding protein [Tamaricihabitans halophyticus]TCP47833.1 WD-40 repeat-containing protein [Tamaricihabitans halophyticus]